MKKVFFVLLLVFCVPLIALAQTKAEQMGLKGPIKEVIRSYNEFQEKYMFSDTQILQSHASYRNSSLRNRKIFDSKERLLEIYQGNTLSSQYLYDDLKFIFTVQYPDYNYLKHHGNLDMHGRIIREIRVFERLQQSSTTEFFYDNQNRLARTITTRNSPPDIKKVNNKEYEFISSTVSESEYDNFNQLVAYKLFWVTTSGEYLNRMEFKITSDSGLITQSVLLIDGEISETEKYNYLDFDHYGNWTKRIQITIRNDSESKELIVTRQITYY